MTIIYGTTGNDTITPGTTTIAKKTPDIVYGSGNPLDPTGTGDVINFATSTADNDLFGSTGDDSITGGAGNDVIYSNGGNDTLTGGAGSDQIVVNGSGNVKVSGGLGDDLIYVLASGNDALSGGTGNDLFYVGGASTATISDLGLGGDTLKVTAGSTVTATVTADWAAGSQSFNNGLATLKSAGHVVDVSLAGGSNGWSITNSSATGTSLTGSANNDTITGGAGNDIIIAGAGNDLITGGKGNDSISAGAGNDTIIGFDGADTVDGGAGSNTLQVVGIPSGLASALDSDISNIQIVQATGAATIDLHTQTEGFTILGSSGNDKITSSQGSNIITGGAGNDTFTIGAGSSSINDLGNGKDVLVIGSGATAIAQLYGDWAATVASSNSSSLANAQLNDVGNHNVDLHLISAGTAGFEIIGDSSNSTGATLIGSALADSILGGGGNDTIVGFTSGDSVDGGAGLNTLNVSGSQLSAATDGQLNNIQIVQVSTTAAATIDLSSQSEGFSIIGNTGKDTITGGAGADSINGGAGNDSINGGGGNDSIIGGAGVDTLTGGAGSDNFAFASGDTTAAAFDTITDFAVGAVGTGDAISYSGLMIGGSAVAAPTKYFAAINQSNGVASFLTAPTSVAAAEKAIISSFVNSSMGDMDGNFAFFNVAGKEYLFISDGHNAANAAGTTVTVDSHDTLIQLNPITAVGTIDVTAGHLTILS